jgi:hypothetical protein
LFEVINECTILDTVDDVSELTIEGGVSVQVVTSQEEFQGISNRVCNVHLDALWVSLWSELDESDTALCSNTVTVVNVGPDTLDIGIVNVGNNVGLPISRIAGCEVVIALSLPDSQ